MGEEGGVEEGLDREERVAFLDVLAFLKVDGEEFSADLGFDFDSGDGFRVADGAEVKGEIFLECAGEGDWDWGGCGRGGWGSF